MRLHQCILLSPAILAMWQFGDKTTGFCLSGIVLLFTSFYATWKKNDQNFQQGRSFCTTQINPVIHAPCGSSQTDPHTPRIIRQSSLYHVQSCHTIPQWSMSYIHTPFHDGHSNVTPDTFTVAMVNAEQPHWARSVVMVTGCLWTAPIRPCVLHHLYLRTSSPWDRSKPLHNYALMRWPLSGSYSEGVDWINCFDWVIEFIQ